MDFNSQSLVLVHCELLTAAGNWGNCKYAYNCIPVSVVLA